MEDMDALEQMAWDLEDAQQRRFKKAKAGSSPAAEQAFWDVNEFAVFETIKTFRAKSRTFHPDHLR